jgi:hypothetical protein
MQCTCRARESTGTPWQSEARQRPSDTLLNMETTCSRCHQTVEEGTSFCPNCGLPQLMYNADAAPEAGAQPVRWDEAVRDASSVAWKPALRSALLLAIPAGLAAAFLDIPGLLIMGISGAWTVSLYMRARRPAWITIGAGARIGLAFGIIAGWLAFAAAGGALFLQRYAMHQGDQIDAEWKQSVVLQEQFSDKFFSSVAQLNTPEARQARAQNQALMLSPEGHAGWIIAGFAFSSSLFVLFAMAGGALGARMQVRRKGLGARE